MVYFSSQKFPFGKILEGLAVVDVGIFYDHVVNFPAIWYILWSFGIHIIGRLVYFPPFW
jgi:hypothetical protein